MTPSRADLILHPVRMRLLVALAHRELTARQLSELLPDVPQATLYHHLGMLTRARLLRVVSERPVRGTIEKRYALAEDNITLSPAELANASRDDHLRYFTIFVTTLLSDFARYLQQDAPVDLFADGVAYQEVPFYLSDDELAQAGAAINRALLPFLENQPAPHRRRRLFALVTFPDNEFPDADSHPNAEPPTDITREE
ncbi:MAG TPA: helix-turn-helix domain-containing protein [Ktedonobacterales bacterium]|nr:helix-turn-helix domain-containing protein [Ktedonobacterales bacterium]